MLYNLNRELRKLKGETVEERLAEAAEKLPDVGIVGLNGIPFISEPPMYFGRLATIPVIRRQLLFGLGMGGALTYMNNTLSYVQLGEKCLELGHDWAFRSMTVTVCFAGCPTFVELSFARDRRFHLSWCEPARKTDFNLPRVFTATASIKDWKKYLKNRNSEDFLNTQRLWLKKTHELLSPLVPNYFE